MGTRHLICVVVDGKMPVANYGQWDGYLEGQGQDILDFIKNTDMNVFKDKVRLCTFLFGEDLQEIVLNGDWTKTYPHLTRDAGAKILDMILKSDKGLTLIDSTDFAGDGLFCEFAYVLDLDNEMLEVYTGFHKTPVPEGERFHYLMKPDEEYSPVKLQFKMSFNEASKGFTQEHMDSY